MSWIGGVADPPACSTLDRNRAKNPCLLCSAAAYCCGAVGPRPIAALLGRFLPRLGPLVHSSGPFFLGSTVRGFVVFVMTGARSASIDVQWQIGKSRRGNLLRRRLERPEIPKRHRRQRFRER